MMSKLEKSGTNNFTRNNSILYNFSKNVLQKNLQRNYEIDNPKCFGKCLNSKFEGAKWSKIKINGVHLTLKYLKFLRNV